MFQQRPQSSVVSSPLAIVLSSVTKELPDSLLAEYSFRWKSYPCFDEAIDNFEARLMLTTQKNYAHTICNLREVLCKRPRLS